MTNEPDSIRRTLAVSVAAHVLIFGTVFAFAQFGGGMLRGDRPVIVVSLVSEGKGGGASEDRIQRLKEALSERVRTELSDEAKLEQAPSSSSPAVGWQAPEGAARVLPGQEQAYLQGSGSGAVPSEGTVAGPAGGVAAGKHIGYSSVEWQLLQASLERVKTYPRLARERGIEGTVLVRFRVHQSGSIEHVDIVKSSGARILDEASISTVYRAAPVPYVDGWIEVPMSYVLK
ncbi:MAG: energy transducer TonB [Nitrospirae bacterium]|nr:energy transducer TonB [Nitrospirota bacterium]NTW65000.1 energy transducer TonB [Nitrospirota bacterium]